MSMRDTRDVYVPPERRLSTHRWPVDEYDVPQHDSSCHCAEKARNPRPQSHRATVHGRSDHIPSKKVR
jgi:hypothetical protein